MVGWAPSLSQSAIHHLKSCSESASPDLLVTSHAWEMREGHRPHRTLGPFGWTFRKSRIMCPFYRLQEKHTPCCYILDRAKLSPKNLHTHPL